MNFFNTIMSYVNCFIEKLQNFWKCFFWYVIYIFQETANLLITGLCNIIGAIIGNNTLSKI